MIWAWNLAAPTWHEWRKGVVAYGLSGPGQTPKPDTPVR
jgi:hypothetical protein